MPPPRAPGAALLAKYLADHAVLAAMFAAELGVSGTTIGYWLSGQRKPTLAHRRVVERVTRGVVPAAAWVTPDVWRVELAREAWLQEHRRSA